MSTTMDLERVRAITAQCVAELAHRIYGVDRGEILPLPPDLSLEDLLSANHLVQEDNDRRLEAFSRGETEACQIQSTVADHFLERIAGGGR